ncbi:tRNA (N6-threonylcarbamoyladenosine(37)-N6)-methyltransferase TrmO [Dermatobacter hominis]|uniref:tRNA (N6-threonylcarbamoyladenosine(37)-N6)-methyltransferase TrmO n=1 Tax=Dermatobacter hominis TaxID=2884263 RepID=UPI001D117DE6|nr:tRNA (N6-threonylcarbamoyladenosine(37)-N6)-methyltransferase TrmO [Dermatobacter hominis]UDY34294.1 tRNA (N6-threonylcarbamoyladenosine(37)-N6)-methyltransferase TrmO [Dermatobacter hominis]
MSTEDGPAELTVRPIGRVASSLVDPADAPRQGDEAPSSADLVIDARLAPALDGIEVGDRLVVLTWLHLADREELTVHPRGDLRRPAVGVLATRSPGRPNPIGLHEVTVERVAGTTVTVQGLEAVDGTPVVDLKPVLGPIDER